MKHLPKKIWFLWLQGFDEAPIEVKKCYESWVRNNPGWQVIFIDRQTITQYVHLPEWNIEEYVASELLRLNLLARYGGVWADATCYCVKPLDEWLPGYMNAGFFAFNRPGPDRMLSSWFMASYPQNPITMAFQKRVNEFWEENTGIRLIENTRWKFLYKHLQRSNPQIWFSSFFTKILKVHPYFWFHYTFENVYLKFPSVKKTWDSVPKFSADIPHKLLFAGLFNPMTEEVRSEIDQKTTPVYKLTWKYRPEQYLPGTIMYYLFNGNVGVGS